jgi:predicted RND superfamily exporter protein
VSFFDRLVGTVTEHSRIAIVVMLLLTVGISAGAPQVSQESSLDQFQTDSVEADKLDFVQSNFSSGNENSTTAQIIVREENGNVLDKQSLLGTLEYQRTLRADDRTADSLTGDRPTFGIANVLATAAIQREEGQDVRALATEIRTLNQSVQRERTALRENRTELETEQTALQQNSSALQNRSDALNATARQLRAGLTTLRQNPNASVRATFESVQANTSVELNRTDFGIFRQSAQQLRTAQNQSQVQSAYRLGTRGVLRDDFRALSERGRELRLRGQELQERGQRLQERADALQQNVSELKSLADELQTERAEFQNATSANLSAQIDQLESMNESEIDDVIGLVLSDDNDGGQTVFGFMPTGYEPGSTESSATMLLVTQTSTTDSAASGAASDQLRDAQLAMQDIAQSRDDGQEYLVFGSGVISDEIQSSQEDSILIVAPMAAIFVFFALVIAYRDILDILLGLFGIAAVLGWTFGFMGWTGVDFNQIFIAVPVLLIGLSIDYAIHIFMRHREERQVSDGLGPRASMRVALGGVGVALVWVTATTVIGFLSNLTSPVPPIQDFGVVSSFGITAAFLIFGVLIPGLKVELDELLERFGFDREKRAFGTGGGAFSSVLAVGSTAARKSPMAVILLALVVTAGGGYGATQVDTSFSQSDFLAEEPPDWMDELPEPFRPGSYSAKSTLEYVNDNFVREDSQAQILIEGDVTKPATLRRIDTAGDAAEEKGVTQTLSNGEADITSPLSAMQSVAAENETFNATFQAADTDGDGVPDRNVEGVYDELFEVAPDTAQNVLYRTEDGSYEAARMVVSVRGGASGSAITTQMRDVASVANRPGVTVTATGGAILNKIVQDQLLETVVESLLITLVAVFAFLMVTYRITEGSATLGAVTLMPVAFSVAWILGTMFLADIPFNVLTGMITSLTVGLGVAYSIHLSERYNQELERTGDVWDAMDRAVTGTGGALLGSAATTVGGFGVLVFAILPPLQQFGIITGMTIIYAFLASVLVLPSMLVVWTKYAGPSFAAAQLTDSDAPDDSPPDAGGEVGTDTEAVDTTPVEATNGAGETGTSVDPTDDAGESGTPVEPTGGVSEADTPVEPSGEPVGATADSEWTDAGFVPASVVDDGEIRAVRSISQPFVAPGTAVETTVTVENADGRFLLREELPELSPSVTETDPEPVDVVGHPSELDVAWDVDGTAELTYEVTVPEDAVDGTEYALSGTLLVEGGDREVGGDTTISVVTDLFERIVTAGEVSDEDLRLARDRYADDSLSEAQFQRIRRAWLREGGSETPKLTDGTPTPEKPTERQESERPTEQREAEPEEPTEQREPEPESDSADTELDE